MLTTQRIGHETSEQIPLSKIILDRNQMSSTAENFFCKFIILHEHCLNLFVGIFYKCKSSFLLSQHPQIPQLEFKSGFPLAEAHLKWTKSLSYFSPLPLLVVACARTSFLKVDALGH